MRRCDITCHAEDRAASQINAVVDEAGELVLSVGSVSEGLLSLGLDFDDAIDSTILSGIDLIVNVSSSIDDSLSEVQSEVIDIGNEIKVRNSRLIANAPERSGQELPRMKCTYVYVRVLCFRAGCYWLC